ncbi:hypothetical protein BCR44DRAFT_1000304 [Catenaria anguillulae PL171]|uniref:Uncharacterized protein n=1 Tax=Catenaria anguillulae PL171 TaxID=765915 RepID=A0A1Y2I537_9FUNG|nr:hypothetical protein BCR44DRAFT_1000304 [Catenaria anguillulae PL171]
MARMDAAKEKAALSKSKPVSRKRKTRSAAVDDGNVDKLEIKVKVEPVNEETEQPAQKKRRRTARRTTPSSDSVEPAIELPQPEPVAVSASSAEPELQLVGHYPPSRSLVPIMPHPHVMPPLSLQQPIQFPMVNQGTLLSQSLQSPPPSVYVPKPLRAILQPTASQSYSDYHNQAWMSAQSTTAGGKYVPIAPAPATSDSLLLPRLSRAVASAVASGRKSPVSFMR